MIFVEKTLAESAREYQQQHEKKVDMKEVDIKTGEEGESNVLQVNKPFKFFVALLVSMNGALWYLPIRRQALHLPTCPSVW